MNEQRVSSFSAAELRDQFDRSFASAPSLAQKDVVDLIAFGIGGGRFALPIDDLVGLEKAGIIIGLPGQSALCAGVVGLRGEVLPVFSLPKLLAPSSAEAAKPMTWLAVCRSKAPVALGFGDLQGHLRIERADRFEAPAGVAPQFAREAFRARGGPGLVLDVPRVLEHLTKGSKNG